MAIRNLIFSLSAVLMFVSVPAGAHHSFVSQFDPGQLVQMQGKVVRVRWTNPHAFFDIEVSGENDEAEVWAFELGSPNTLIRYGWYRDTLQLGDEITVDGYLARNGSNLANAKSVMLADGTLIEAGSSILQETR